MGFPELFEKTIDSIHFIPDIYPCGVSLLTPIHFMLLASFSALWWPNIWPKMGFPELLKIYWLNSVFSWSIPTCVTHYCKIEICIGYFWMRWVVIRAFMGTACFVCKGIYEKRVPCLLCFIQWYTFWNLSIQILNINTFKLIVNVNIYVFSPNPYRSQFSITSLQ